jgi:hypothetical protein
MDYGYKNKYDILLFVYIHENVFDYSKSWLCIRKNLLEGYNNSST